MSTFQKWQDLIGAIIGGTLGVVGALIVAQSARNQERRNAARMLNRDLSGVLRMIRRLTHQGKVAPSSLSPDLLRSGVTYSCYQLSPLFETHMSTVIGIDTTVDMFLTRFRNSFSDVENAVRVFRETADGATPETLRAQEDLPASLEKVNNYALMAMHLLPLCEFGPLGRTLLKMRRYLLPTPEDKRTQSLIERIMRDDSDV